MNTGRLHHKKGDGRARVSYQHVRRVQQTLIYEQVPRNPRDMQHVS